jgi:hypothetical protein
MIAFVLIATLLFASQTYAQKTCTKISAQSQNCLVTITITANAPQYVIQRQDGTGGPIVEKTVTAKIVQDTFNDSGNIAHAYKAIGLYADGKKIPSNIESWTTPAISAEPLPPSNYVNIVTDKAVATTRCKTESCAVRLQVPKSTLVNINGMPRKGLPRKAVLRKIVPRK